MKTASEIFESLSKDTAKHEIKFREGSHFGNKAKMLAFIDARYVMDRLDEATDGVWKNDYREIKTSVTEKDNGIISAVYDIGKLYCGISILMDGEWITKWDVGVKSNFEAEKGEASDSFKRAGVQWGIGRDLYSLGSFFAPFEANGKVKFGWKPNGWNEQSPLNIPDPEVIAPHNRPTKAVIDLVKDAYEECNSKSLFKEGWGEKVLLNLSKFDKKELHTDTATSMLKSMQELLNKNKIEGDL
tara:strand:+ start:4503 stop:5231 length:729 start_codon:yes stop_codon:yes gene_type:complete